MSKVVREQSTSELIVCDICKGTGTVSERINAYEDEDVICKKCNGMRVLCKTVTTTLMTVD